MPVSEIVDVPPQPPQLGQSIPILFRPRPEPIPFVIKRPSIILYPVPINSPGSIPVQVVARIPNAVVVTAKSVFPASAIARLGVGRFSYLPRLASAGTNPQRRSTWEEDKERYREEEEERQRKLRDEQLEQDNLNMMYLSALRRSAAMAGANPIDVANGLLGSITSRPPGAPLNPFEILSQRVPQRFPDLLSPQDIINRVPVKKFILTPESIAATNPVMAVARRQAISNAISGSQAMAGSPQFKFPLPEVFQPYFESKKEPLIIEKPVAAPPPNIYINLPPSVSQPQSQQPQPEIVETPVPAPIVENPAIVPQEPVENPGVGGLFGTLGSAVYNLGDAVEGIGSSIGQRKDGSYPLFGVRDEIGKEIGLGPLGNAKANVGFGVNLSPLLSPILSTAGGLVKGVGAVAGGLLGGGFGGRRMQLEPAISRRSGVKHEQSAIEQYGIGNQNLMGNVQQINWDKKNKKRRALQPFVVY